MIAKGMRFQDHETGEVSYSFSPSDCSEESRDKQSYCDLSPVILQLPDECPMSHSCRKDRIFINGGWMDCDETIAAGYVTIVVENESNPIQMIAWEGWIYTSAVIARRVAESDPLEPEYAAAADMIKAWLDGAASYDDLAAASKALYPHGDDRWAVNRKIRRVIEAIKDEQDQLDRMAYEREQAEQEAMAGQTIWTINDYEFPHGDYQPDDDGVCRLTAQQWAVLKEMFEEYKLTRFDDLSIYNKIDIEVDGAEIDRYYICTK